MCLTEPQAGSDVGSAKTSASRNGDGSYSIRGTKIFISAGDHDLTTNIVHLVLARVEGAPSGTKGLTLFIVPNIRAHDDGTLLEPNDVQVAGIEHKMGINGSATCLLNFGDAGKCFGWPVGGDAKLNQGMPQMFRLMNSARIAVGIQGISVASSAFLNALEYAKERKQGSSMKHWKDPTAPRVSIIEHADVRRMLIDMKSRVEGVRALAVKLAHHTDCARALSDRDEAKAAYHQGQVDLLVPLVKAYGSDQGFRVCETAIQTYGGVGYTRDFPVEQYCRDAKIFSIYEGTDHIQAMDLVGRKLGQAGGANLRAFLADIGQFVRQTATHPTLGPAAKTLSFAQEALGASAMRMLHVVPNGQRDAGTPSRESVPRDDGRDRGGVDAARRSGDRAGKEEHGRRGPPRRSVLRRQSRRRPLLLSKRASGGRAQSHAHGRGGPDANRHLRRRIRYRMRPLLTAWVRER